MEHLRKTMSHNPTDYDVRVGYAHITLIPLDPERAGFEFMQYVFDSPCRGDIAAYFKSGIDPKKQVTLGVSLGEGLLV